MNKVAPYPIHCRRGFTLIELSIVLVIIGLIVGGILVGRDLIAAATIRAQITQIEKYNSAVNTFIGKYGSLPGDMPDPQATQFGFISRVVGPCCAGYGDGNGMIEGGFAGYPLHACGETIMFWEDLTTAKLISDGITDASNQCPVSSATLSVNQIIPAAKLGRGNSIIVYGNNGYQYYQILGGIKGISNGYNYTSSQSSLFGMSPLESFAIDNKIDDGYPMTGTVLSVDVTQSGFQYGWGFNFGGASGTASAGNCGSTDTTSTSYNTGGSFANSLICSISIRFQ